MASFFNATSWTGGDVSSAVTLPKPQVKSEKVEPQKMPESKAKHLEEYAELAQLVGVQVPDLGVEAFKAFLHEKDWAIFPLANVIAYMDKKAKAESKDQSGWEWRPLRHKDHIDGANFGTQGRRVMEPNGTVKITEASDLYQGAYDTYYSSGGGEGGAGSRFLGGSNQNH